MSLSNNETIFDAESFYSNYEVLKDLSQSNAEYFKNDTSVVGKGLHSSSLSIANRAVSIQPLVEFFRSICHKYDFDENTPGNGYRSYVLLVNAFVVNGIKATRHICSHRNSYFFRKGTALKELEACDQGLGSLSHMLTHLKTLVEWSDEGCLYPREEHPPEELLARAQNLNQYCFYGRCLGFQFCDSMQTVLKGLAILMASFSELYYSNGGMIGRATSSLWNSSKYLINPELRAKRIVNISQYASVNFCKQFWFLGEIETMKRLPNFVNPSIAVNKIITIPPDPLTVTRLDGSVMDVPIPSAHVGTSPLGIRLLSSVKRQGMIGESKGKNTAPVSDGLMFHCHGGGFVAQSSRSHETYLCHWAKAIEVPIISVDYSLAPEAPFPRALEDTFYAYCWALNNLSNLGSTGKRIVAGGDSAGGNLVLGLTIKCIMEGVRPPDGLFMAYVPVIVSIIPSPARLLCLMDPLLPLGFLTGCLRAYACTPEAYEIAVKGYEEKLRRKSRKSSRKSTSSSSSNVCLASGNNSVDIVGVEVTNQITESHDNKMNGKSAEEITHINGEINGKEVDVTHLNGNFENISQNGRNVIVIDDAIPIDLADHDIEYEAPVPLPPSMSGKIENENKETDSNIKETEIEVKENEQDKKGSYYKFSNITSAITSTLSSFSSQNNEPIEEPVSNNVEELRKSDSQSSIADDFEEVMLPCPLEMLKFEVPCNPLLSPYYAEDEILKQFPPVSFVTLHMDPCLDDCVEFSKKMKRLGKDIKLDILEGLPHGFLNFSLLSKEAYDASKMCTDRIKTMLDLQPESTSEEVN